MNYLQLFLFCIAIGAITGCPEPNALEPNSQQLPSKHSEDTSVGKESKFPCEIDFAYDIDGAKFSETQFGDWELGDDRGSTFAAGDVTLRAEIKFVGHIDGKDTYDISWTITTKGAPSKTDKRVTFTGERIELFAHDFGSAVMRPAGEATTTPQERQTE